MFSYASYIGYHIVCTYEAYRCLVGLIIFLCVPSGLQGPSQVVVGPYILFFSYLIHLFHCLAQLNIAFSGITQYLQFCSFYY